MNRILEPETEDTVTGAVTGEEFEEQFIQEKDLRAVVEGAVQRAAEVSQLKQENQILRQEEERPADDTAGELWEPVEPVQEEDLFTTSETLGPEETPAENPSGEMSASDPGDEGEKKLDRGVSLLTLAGAAIGACSFLVALLGLLLIVPTSNYDLSVQGYRLLYANPASATSFLQWWQQWSLPLGGLLTVSGAAPLFLLGFLAFRRNKKGQRD